MRVLIADDSLLSRRLLEQTLRGWGYDVLSACDGTEAWRLLSAEDAPALAILDWMMPGYSGPDLCRMIRQAAREPYTYLLLLTSRNEKEDVVAGMDAGADDYITKPFDKHELKVRLRAGTRIVELQEQLVRAREELRIQATRDNLTGLWNRASILEHLDRELSRSRREGTWVGVAMADLDHFKQINDTWGHDGGDAALRHSAIIMRDSLRPYDSVGRYGGEEFLIVLPGTNLSNAAWLTDRVRVALRSDRVSFKGGGIAVTCSFGATSAFGGRLSAREMISIADEALYTAKRNGRDQVVGRDPVQTLGSPDLVHDTAESTATFERLGTGSA
ncbi:MAG TPA: diguanylate cyclase [Bryobacteraceae bacterium]|nr:diguanylate cyclase [Bryobacteraceae bacterium]